ncbi:histidine kinase dimerization/phospho-acceptor domain-containing protein [Micromonospora sp. WMMD980]|uniref:histidine kinase dimerization/phospho-acceptor domain-containing protein n=1 Tax=Micromonospora sp. WMMD980 TaxID=3016088 RepID=UPI002417F4AF|nr:histidine kinase dimerization/phospho-acceptor domain-containing protein [Micromonospora sp. WMMD980]MDG4803259.1 hypothetical protein [Micromonospora sp. WMMD980]
MAAGDQAALAQTRKPSPGEVDVGAGPRPGGTGRGGLGRARRRRAAVPAAAQARYVADASHQPRSPLATLCAGLDRLAFARVPDGQRDLVALLRRETSRLGDLVADLPLLACIDATGCGVP